MTHYSSMKSAVSMLIAHDNAIGSVNLEAVAKTYAATPEELSAEWERQLSEVSLRPSNSFEIPEGK